MRGKKKRGLSIRLRLIAIIIPIVLVIVVSFFSLSTNMVLKISQEELLAKSQVNAEKISTWTNQIFSELQIYKNAIEDGNFADDEEILSYLKTTVEKSDAYPVGLYMGDETSHRVKQMIELVSKVEEVSRMMDEISRNQAQATVQIVESTGELSEQTRNVTEGSSTVAESAGELKKESMELMNRIGRFKA